MEGEGGVAARVVAVPNYCSSGTGGGCVVLVNLSTLACQPIFFDAELQG